MYLTEINKKRGLVLVEKEYDGVWAIKEFREILTDESLRIEQGEEFPGIHCFTAIALTADYQSPKRFYNEKDRPRACMEEVTGDRDAFTWNQEKIQKALKKYDELQYDVLIEEGNLYREAKIQKLKELKESEKYFGRKHNKKDADGEDMIFRNPATIRQEIRKINEDIAAWEKQTQGKDLNAKSPVRNGYTLSRLEQKIEKKNSFYNQVR